MNIIRRVFYVGLLIVTHDSLCIPHNSTANPEYFIVCLEQLARTNQPMLKVVLHDPMYKSLRTKLGNNVWEARDRLKLWSRLAVLYGGWGSMAARYADDSGGENMLNCAIARGDNSIVRAVAPYVIANL